MNLFLHIGTPKTATTYLQRTLASNGEWLNAQGLSYPRLLNGPGGNHITLFFASALRISAFARGYGIHTTSDRLAFRKRLNRRLTRLLKATPDTIESYVFSSENLSGQLGHPGMTELRNLLSPHFSQIKIVCYIRRQDDGLLSMYAEHMRKGFSSGSFDGFLDRALKDDGLAGYNNYARLLRRWGNVFGHENLIVRRYDKARFVGESGILSDFLSVVKGRTVEIPDTLKKPKHHNVSLSAPLLEYLSEFNAEYPFAINGIPDPKRKKVRPVLNDLPQSAKPTMDAATSERIMRFFETSNEDVRRQWFPQDDALFGPPSSVSETPTLGRISPEEYQLFDARIRAALT